MNAKPIESPPWARGRWCGAVAAVFIAQIALIFWLGERGPIRPRAVRAGPGLKLASAGSTEFFALLDPTLFVLPHHQGFSGPAWLNVWPKPFRSFDWTEPPRWLGLPVAQLGGSFHPFTETNALSGLPVPSMPEPVLALPDISPLVPLASESSVRIEGELAQRRLVAPLAVRGWPQTDLLTNSIIQMVVDAEGWPVSVTLLPPGSGLKEADEFALAQARTARFESVSSGGPETVSSRGQLSRLSWGRLVFEWYTWPATNVATAP